MTELIIDEYNRLVSGHGLVAWLDKVAKMEEQLLEKEEIIKEQIELLASFYDSDELDFSSVEITTSEVEITTSEIDWEERRWIATKDICTRLSEKGEHPDIVAEDSVVRADTLIKAYKASCS